MRFERDEGGNSVGSRPEAEIPSAAVPGPAARPPRARIHTAWLCLWIPPHADIVPVSGDFGITRGKRGESHFNVDIHNARNEGLPTALV